MADNKEVKKKNGYANMYMMSYRRRAFYSIMRTIRVVLGTGLVVLIIYFLLSGVINQVKTGETLVDYALGIGQDIGDFLESMFTDESPLKVTEDGIYFKDADVPDESALEDVIHQE